MHLLISYFLSNTSAKNYRNRIVYVKVIASQRWDVFKHSTVCNISVVFESQCIILVSYAREIETV